MPRKTLNRHPKAAFRPGEHRVRGDEIERLIDLAASDDPEDRLELAGRFAFIYKACDPQAV